MRSISSSVSALAGRAGERRQVAGGRHRRAARDVRRPAGPPRRSRRCPSPEASGVPSIAAAVQTSLSAVAYASASGWRARARAATDGVGPDRKRRPREAASKNSSALRSPPVWRRPVEVGTGRGLGRRSRRSPRPRRGPRRGRRRRPRRPLPGPRGQRRGTKSQTASITPGPRSSAVVAAARVRPALASRVPPEEDLCPNFASKNRAVGDQRLGVGAVGGVEHLGHGRGEQLELVDEHHQRGLAALDRPAVGPVARQAEVAADGLREVVGGGGHHGVRVGAPPAQLRQLGQRLADRAVDPGDPGAHDRRAPCRRRASPRPAPATRGCRPRWGQPGPSRVGTLSCATSPSASPRSPRDPNLPARA